MEEIIKKIQEGEGLSDSELVKAIEHYRQLSEMLSLHGERYALVRIEANGILYRLEGWQRSRKDKR